MIVDPYGHMNSLFACTIQIVNPYGFNTIKKTNIDMVLMTGRRDGIEDESRKNNGGEGTDSQHNREGKKALMVLWCNMREGGVSEWCVKGYVYLSFN